MKKWILLGIVLGAFGFLSPIHEFGHWIAYHTTQNGDTVMSWSSIKFVGEKASELTLGAGYLMDMLVAGMATFFIPEISLGFVLGKCLYMFTTEEAARAGTFPYLWTLMAVVNITLSVNFMVERWEYGRKKRQAKTV